MIGRGTRKSWIEVFRNFAVKGGVFPYQLAFTLLIPLRNIFLSPKTLIQRLELKKDYNVLEIGAGPGYFSSEVARAVPRGVLVLADIQQEMLDLAGKRLAGKRIKWRPAIFASKLWRLHGLIFTTPAQANFVLCSRI